MRRLFFLAVCFLFLTPCIHAQLFKAGVLAGISTSQVDGDTYSGYDKVGIFAGCFVTERFSKTSKWSASFEITYIQKGSRKIPHPDKGDFADYRLDLDYAEVPLLLKYDFYAFDSSGTQKKKFVIEGGIAIGALVHSEEWDAAGQVYGGTPFQRTDYSVLFGLNYFITEHIGFDVRTEYSLIPVRKGGTSAYYQNWTSKFLSPGYYNNLIVFSIRYQF